VQWWFQNRRANWRKTTDVKNFFFRFFLNFGHVLTFFLFSKRFLFKKRWQSPEQQAD